MQILIVSPSLNPTQNINGISSMTNFIIENNSCFDYVHFELGRKDNEKGGFRRIGSILQKFKEWKCLLRKYPDALVHYNFPLEKPSVLRDTPFMHEAIRTGHKMVVHIHGGRLLTSANIPFPFRQILNHVFSWQVLFIALSDKEVEILRNKFQAKKVVSLPNCIDLRDSKIFERHYYDKTSPLTLGYLGRITSTKGMEYLLKACILLKKRNIPYRLKLAGIEDVNERFISQFSNSLDDHFEYCGSVTGEIKNNFLRSLDLLVMPTFFEGLPLSLLECMSYGIVPIITPVGSITTVVTDQQNGMFIKVKDTDSIVEAITYLHAHRDKLEHMSISARNTIYEHFNPSIYISNLNNIYNKCLNLQK